ncbi:MAG TPA: PhoH family protein [Crocinitomicaceae bacterium]|nr:PhoH family protein [Crocinitomicaceae bacterium]
MEKTIEIEGINLAEFYGINNVYLNQIKSYFPKLKVIARGNTLTLIGDDEVMEFFEKKFQMLLNYFHKFNQITENVIEQIILDERTESETINDGSEVIVHGNGGLKVRARTLNQRRLVQAVSKNAMVFAVGPAGTGKTYTAVALAVKALKEKEVKRIILTRPAVEAGENLGFLPGDMKEKLDPYMMPLYDALSDMISPEKLKEMLENRVIEIAPLAFMRGRTLDKAFVILDEAQNATVQQMKMFLTRMGQTAKFVITGDMSQVDLPHKQRSGLSYATNILQDVEGIEIIQLKQSDVVRHPLVKKIIDAFDKAEEREDVGRKNR